MSTGTELINTQTAGVGGYAGRRLAQESFAYFHGNPYPRFAFDAQQWPTEKGPKPTPLPYAKLLIAEGAEFVFAGGPPRFTVGDDASSEAYLATVVRRNRLASRWAALAEFIANQGTVAAKFAYVPDDPLCAVRVSFLSIPDECRVWVDPHDQSRLLMARVQYPYRDAVTGAWFYFREEWTAGWHVIYRPKEAGAYTIEAAANLPGYDQSLGDGDGWEIDQQEENPFGMIPITLIRNKRQEGSPLGVGDCWGSFRLMDRLALTMHGEDRHNQTSRGTPVAKNAILTNSGPLLPEEPISVVSETPGVSADFDIIEPTGAWRQWSHMTLDRWEDLLYAQVGLSKVDPAAITNKGNMTQLALKTVYSRTLATSDRKRTLWGEDGLSLMFADLLLALQRMGTVKEVKAADEDTVVTAEWSDYFAATPDDVAALSSRTIAQTKAGVLPLARAAERIALAEGLPKGEVPTLLQELPPPAPSSPEAQQPDAEDVDPGLPNEGADLAESIEPGDNLL